MAASNVLKAAHTMLVFTDPFHTDHFSHIDFTNIKDLPEYVEEAAIAATDGISEKDKWKTLTQYDKLSPGEIHRRVQDDIWFKTAEYGNSINNVNVGELPIKFNTTGVEFDEDEVEAPDTASGRADIYKIVGDTTYLWEVKPYSYFNKNRSIGIQQLSQYVYYGLDANGQHGNYQFGQMGANGSISNNNLEFHAYLLCSNITGTLIWWEKVTYKVNYYVEDDSLIIYTFERSSEETDPALNPDLLPLAEKALEKFKEYLKQMKSSGQGNWFTISSIRIRFQSYS